MRQTPVHVLLADDLCPCALHHACAVRSDGDKHDARRGAVVDSVRDQLLVAARIVGRWKADEVFAMLKLHLLRVTLHVDG